MCMSKLSAIILSACFLLAPLEAGLLLLTGLAGCRFSDTDASSESHYDRVSAQIEQLKAESQAAAPTGSNIKIVVNMLATNLNDYVAVDSLWRYVKQNVQIARRPDVFRRSGLKIGLAGDGFKARMDITKRQLKSSEDTELFVVVSDGYAGYINIGKEISVPRFYYFGRWYSGVDYEFRRAGRSLKVTARRLPSGLIDMELTPVFSEFLSDGGDMELTELSTRVTARPGQPVVLGGADTADENVAAALFSYSKQAEKKQTLIMVTPYIQ